MAAGLILALMSLGFGEKWSSPLVWSGEVQISMVLLVIFGSILAFTSFNYLLKAVSPEKVATSTYVNPIVALLLGWYFLDEQITLQSVIAATILLTGVYFINTKKTLAIFERFKIIIFNHVKNHKEACICILEPSKTGIYRSDVGNIVTLNQTLNKNPWGK